MATIAYALTTKEKVKSRLGITATTFDTLIDSLINNITDFIEKYCDRRFKKIDYSNEIYDGSYLDGSKKRWLILKNVPVIGELTAFQYLTGNQANPVWTSFSRTDYDIENQSGIIRVYDNLPQGLRNIRVSYSAGYLIDFANENTPASHTLPFDLSGLAERLIVKEFKRRESIGRSSESLGDSAFSWRDGLEDEDILVLERYRRLSFV